MMLPAMPPTPYYLPYYPGTAGRFLMPVPTMPGMPAPMAWVPVILVPMPSAQGLPAAGGGGVDYGPVADTPVVELPMPEEEPSPPPAEPGASAGPESPAAAANEPVATPVSGEPVVADPAADALAAPPWSAPAVDYGPVTETPVVDLVTLEKQLSAAPMQNRKSGKQSSLSAAKPAAAPKKSRMCWDNGIVAPCR
jgi:hypothetical protein